jgi:hypothetical protein
MRQLSAYEASGAGFRLIRREPRAVLAWVLLWFVTFSAAAWTVAAGKPVSAAKAAAPVTLSDAAERFGPYGAVVVALFMLVWLVTVVAIYRAVLRPNERRWFYLRFGPDEMRLGILTLAACLVAVPLGGAPAYLVFVLTTPFLRFLPDATRDIAGLGVLVTVWLDVWLGVRLSLIAVETFSEQRFHLSAYWPLTRGRFWYLLACYFLFFLVLLGLTVVFLPLMGLVAGPAPELRAGDLMERGGLLLRAGALTAVISIFWTLSATLFCAAQAHALRAIVGGGRAGVAPA